MKIRAIVGIAAAAIVLSALAAASIGAKAADQNKVRIAFFPNISHAAPIVGIEKGFFAESLGGVQIEPTIVDSGPQAIEALLYMWALPRLSMDM